MSTWGLTYRKQVIKMSGKRSIIITTLIIILMMGQVTSTYANNDIPHLEVTVKDTTFTAGTHGNIAITIHNGGDYDATQIEAIITSATPGISIIGDSQKVFNNLDSGKSKSYNVMLRVDQSVLVGAYLITMQLSYFRAVYGIVAVQVPITIVVNQQFLPMIELTTSPKNLVGGSWNNVTIGITNVASIEITDLALSLSSASTYLSVEDAANLRAASVESGEHRGFKVRVYVLESAPIGSYALTASTTYTSAADDNYRQIDNLSLEVTSPFISKIPILTVTNLNNTVVLPGRTFNVHVRVDCSDAPSYNVKATLTLDAAGILRPLSPTTTSLGDIETGDSKEVKCKVLVDGSSSAAQIPTTLTLTYFDQKGTLRTTTETVTVQIGEIVDFEIMNPELIEAKQGSSKVKIDSSLILKGTSKIQFTTVNIISDPNIQVIPESSYYIGTIYPDSPVIFTVKFNVPVDADLGDKTISIRISYLDNLNIPSQQLLSYQINIVKATPTIGNDFWEWLRYILGLG